MRIQVKRITIWCLAILLLPLAGCIRPGKTPTIPNTQITTAESLENASTDEPTMPTQSTTTSPLRWYALGDSITQGFYSYLNDEGVAALGLDDENSWASLVAENTGWELTNYSIGGTGYVSKNPSTGGNKQNVREVVEDLCTNHKLQEVDLVTLFCGCNDWKYNLPLGTMEDDLAAGGTLYSNMRWIIETIQHQAPEAQIIVISPINCCRYGSAETGWGMSYSFDKNGTLEDIYQAELEICEYYGIPFIDMLHDSTTVSTDNILNVLPDGVHPTPECHKTLALELEKKITARLFGV